jgi:glyoxylase-like metal-dependent hydrolase (beta-lactamase superfamily II)
MYPRQTTTEWNGFPYSDETVQVLKVDEPVDEAALTIPEATRTAFAANANRALPSPTVFDGSKGIDVTDWLVEVPSGYNVSIAKQPDGLVIIEATTGNDHADAVMAFAKKRFPGLPIKAVVTTSDAWPHISGIREYVAAGIPIYALDLNVSILTRFVKAPHTLSPDRLQQSPRAPVFRPVTSKTVIGTGETRIELVPVRGEIGERMMLAWIPGAKVLYSSDMIQRANPSRGVPFFMPLMLMEVERAAAREKITGIERVFGMHLAPTPWSDVLAAIAAANAQ